MAGRRVPLHSEDVATAAAAFVLSFRKFLLLHVKIVQLLN
jgi:hypothetical protein